MKLISCIMCHNIIAYGKPLRPNLVQCAHLAPAQASRRLRRVNSGAGLPPSVSWRMIAFSGRTGAKRMPDLYLDTTGLRCPLPILKAKKAIRQVPSGGTLEVIATDPGAVEDFETFCRVGGHVLVESSEHDGVFRFLIRHSG